MQKKLITENGQEIAVFSGLTEKIATASDFLDVLVNAGCPTIALNQTDLSENFFKLSTGLAGEMLQKVSNYHKRLVILGDFSAIASKSFQDFMRESNATGKVVFVGTLAEAGKKLR